MVVISALLLLLLQPAADMRADGVNYCVTFVRLRKWIVAR